MEKDMAVEVVDVAAAAMEGGKNRGADGEDLRTINRSSEKLTKGNAWDQEKLTEAEELLRSAALVRARTAAAKRMEAHYRRYEALVAIARSNSNSSK